MKHHILLSVVLFGALGVSGAQAADPERGKALHEQYCIGCHANMTGGKPELLYTRRDRRVHDLAGLRRQVQRCEQNLELKWFDDDLESVVEYLNKNYYHF
ncbi:MAG: hypothetical protein D6717_08280 [Gammaproteobacteria bacterium]|nr:MAG: hypothetical protein D6717_08280 [Gammaproteobacteria bacterium]